MNETPVKMYYILQFYYVKKTQMMSAILKNLYIVRMCSRKNFDVKHTLNNQS